MTTFGACARLVRDSSLSPGERRSALRGCVACFGPYGFTATWARITAGRRIATHAHGSTHAPDLLAALDELEAARAVWLEGAARYAERRVREKAIGMRVPRDPWPEPIAYCPDPSVYPDGPIAEVIARCIAAYAARRPGCPNCGDLERRGCRGRRICRRCGIVIQRV